jgi:hypothetical protein
MSRQIRVIILEAGNPEAKVIEKFDHSLENLQAVVGGYIEAIRVNDSITIWINEEGKLIDGIEPNFNLIGEGKPYDIVMGDVLIAGTDHEGETVSLTDEEIQEVQERFLNRVNFKMF